MDNVSSSSATPPPVPATSTEDKTVAIVAYITLIGFIVAIVMHGNKKTKLGAYHLRQMLGLILASILGVIPLLGLLVFVFLLVLWIFGIMAAANGQFKPVPVLGKLFEKWFGTAFE